MCSALLVLQPYGSMYGSCIPVMGSMLLCSGSSPEKHASLSSLFHQYRPAEPPQKSMLLCPSFISPAQRSLPRKACFSVPLPSAPRSGASPKKHASLPLFHQPRAAEPPQKSMLLCPSSISTAQRKLPRKARMRLYPPTSISTAQRSLPKKACFSAPLPSAPRSGGSPEKHASLSRFHQPRAAEAPHRKAYVSTPLPSESRSGGSPEKHTSLRVPAHF